jgi:GNAT superfamily N-acetyltransferase
MANMDMIVPLLRTPPVDAAIADLRRAGILIRRANPWELSATRTFIETHFTVGWADEASVGFSNKPVSVFLAIRDGQILGFAAYECTRRAFFGPTGVAPRVRGKGIGKALLLASLLGLREMGYVYGIVGGAGPTGFYERACGACVIPDSCPGIYADGLAKAKTRRKQR